MTRAILTYQVGGNHAVRLVTELRELAHWRLIRFNESSIDVVARHHDFHNCQYLLALSTRRKWRYLRETVTCHFAALYDAQAIEVAEIVSRAWANGRLPATPIGRRNHRSWQLYVSAVAEGVVRRSIQGNVTDSG